MHRGKVGAVHTVNVIASKRSVSVGNSISIYDYCYYLKMLALMFIAANQTALTVFQQRLSAAATQ